MKRQNRDWVKIVREQAASGTSVQEYCIAKGIHPNRFYKKRKINERSAMVEICPPSNGETAVSTAV